MSELKIDFVVAQNSAGKKYSNLQLMRAVLTEHPKNAVLRTKLERELRHWKYFAAKKLCDPLRNYHLKFFFTANQKQMKHCEFTNPKAL